MPLGNFGSKPVAEPGTIVMWAGLIDDIPSGWALCDGSTSEQPDLLGRFPKQVADSNTNPGSTGGQDTLSLDTSQIPSHSHNTSTEKTGIHQHEVLKGWDAGWGGWEIGGNDNRNDTSTSGGHGHSVSVQDAGGGGTAENRPEYIELAYIVKT